MSTPDLRPETAPRADDAAPGTGLSRRAVVVGGALAGAGLLAACSSSSSSSGTATSAAPAPSSPSATSPAPTGSPGGTVLTPASAVPVGGGVIVDVGDQKVVVTQPSAGVFEGFSAVCPHEGCNCNEVVDQQIVCPCHNSRFSITDGAVQEGPARSGLAPLAVQVQGTDVVLA